MTSKLTPAALAYTADGQPYSPAFDDIYHSADGGFAQAEAVFLCGNQLPANWAQRDCFTILETGFGLGTNFLATWAAWRSDPQRPARLHFVSVEKYPCTAAELEAWHTRFAATWPQAQQLLRLWPLLIAGFHRLHFENGGITLTLIFGDALEWLPELRARVDAFYLDGFAPSKNPELWSERLFKQLARLAAIGATCASYTVARSVRDGLIKAGFTVSKQPGFGSKRDRLAGQYLRQKTLRPQYLPPREVLIIGAGLAGTSMTWALARRGWAVQLLDRQSGPGMETSGNRAGILLPTLSRDDNYSARLSRAALLYANRHLGALQQTDDLPWAQTGVLQQATTEEEATRFADAVQRLDLPESYVRLVDREQARALVGAPVHAGGWWFAQGGWASPAALCRAQAAGVLAHWRQNVAALRHDGQMWQALDASSHVLAQAPTLIMTNASDMLRLLPQSGLSLLLDRRQVSHMPVMTGFNPKAVVCGDGYCLPAVNGEHCLGASRDLDCDDESPSQAAHKTNCDKLQALFDLEPGVECADWSGKVGWRPGTSDRLPLVGVVHDHEAPVPPHTSCLWKLPRLPNVYTLNGLGARGLTWAPLMAELLACELTGEPLPVEATLVDAVAPRRQWLRKLAADQGTQTP